MIADSQALGIAGIGVYLPVEGVSNFARMNQFEVDERFINEKLGVRRTLVKDADEATSDLAVRAVRALTQNPDYNLPHTAAIVHGKLGLPERCAAFDISLGCSGWVYGLSVINAFMAQNGMQSGLLVTADPSRRIPTPRSWTRTTRIPSCSLAMQPPRPGFTPHRASAAGALHLARLALITSISSAATGN